MISLKTILKKVKYFIYNLLQPQIAIPSSFRLLSRRDSDFQKFIIRECTPSDQYLVDLNDNLKIFGRNSNKYEISEDIFSNFDFSNKKWDKYTKELKGKDLIIIHKIDESLLIKPC